MPPPLYSAPPPFNILPQTVTRVNPGGGVIGLAGRHESPSKAPSRSWSCPDPKYGSVGAVGFGGNVRSCTVSTLEVAIASFGESTVVAPGAVVVSGEHAIAPITSDRA